METYLKIKNIKLWARVGVLEEERELGQGQGAGRGEHRGAGDEDRGCEERCSDRNPQILVGKLGRGRTPGGAGRSRVGADGGRRAEENDG